MDVADRRALASATNTYRHFADVRAVSFGSKFTDGQLQNVQAIQFFVGSKIPDDDLKRSLPRFVYGRHTDGTLDRERKIPTDVIELGTLELCCAAGDPLDREGAEGAVTLIFRNQAADGRLLVLTCSHVAVDVGTDSKMLPLIGGQADCQFTARVIGNTKLDNNVLEFDLAVAEVIEHDPGLLQRVVTGSPPIVLDGFADVSALAPNNALHCASPRSGARTIVCHSAPQIFHGIYAKNGSQISIGHLVACQGQAVEGDSGGIVFEGMKAVGIVVARGSAGWVLIHPLADAVAHLSTVSGVTLRCF